MNQMRTGKQTLFQSINLYIVGAVVLSLALLAGATRAYATTLTWTNASGTFSTAENWAPAQPPVPGDATLFTNATSYTVNFTGNTGTMASSIFATGTTGAVTINISPFTWSITNRFEVGKGANSTSTVYLAGGTLNVANFGSAQIRIGDGLTNDVAAAGAFFVTNGTVIAEIINLGASSNGVGKLVVSGPGVVTNTEDGGQLTLGNGSVRPSQLIITNGGKVFVNGEVRIGSTGASNNFVLISGSTSELHILENASGTPFGFRVGASRTQGNMLIVSNGAKVFTANGGTIGANGPSSGGNNTAIVVGAGSAIIAPPGAARNIAIGTNTGFPSNNTLIVYDGGLLSSGGTIQLGNGAPSLSNSFHMGGVGAMSTGTAAYLRFPSASDTSLATFTNSIFTTAAVALSGGSNNVVTISSNATFVLANSVNIFPNTGNATNNLNVDGGINNTLMIDGGTLIDVSGSNQFGVVIGGGNRLVVTNGGKLLTELGTLGAGSSFATAIVTGVSSVWSNTGDFSSGTVRTNVLIVGTGANGNSNYLAVVNGASLFNSGSLLIGNSPTATVNTAVFGGPGAASSVIIQGVLYVGHNGGSTNRLTITTNATVNCGTINAGAEDAVDNTIQISGGTVTGGLVRVYGTNTIVFTSGTLGFTTLRVDGNVLGTATVNVPSGSTLQGIGSVANPVTVANGGILAPGDSPGTLTISNSLVLNNTSVLSYELGTNSDLTVVTGSLTLDGTINVTDAGGLSNGTYTIFTYGSLTDNGLLVGILPGGFSATVSNDVGNSRIVLVVTGGGGGVSYTTWAGNYGLSGGNALGTADPDGDGMSNTNEFLAGFNPTNSAAYLHVISVVRTANNITVTYLGASGDSAGSAGPKTNVLEFTTGTANGSYSNNFASTGQTNILSGGTGLGTVSSFVDTNGATGATRYYRIRVLVP